MTVAVEKVRQQQNGSIAENPTTSNQGVRESVYAAALRATAPLLPAIAVGVTVIVYLVSPNVFPDKGIWNDLSGELAVLVGLLAGVLTWLTIAGLYRPYTAAGCASRRNYNGLRERLDHLKIRVEQAENYDPREEAENGIIGAVRNQALFRVRKECEEIAEGLESKGMPWVTGLGYIELWHRVHHAEEALIKVEPWLETLEGAMRDESRLKNANMDNKESLLERLRKAVAILDSSGTGLLLTEAAQSSLDENTLDDNDRTTPKARAIALVSLSEVRYEINNFRDGLWEGLVHARTRLADTSVLLGLVVFGVLAIAIFSEAPQDKMRWVVAYFLVGALAGLFARAQAEWSVDTAVDDFGLSKARLLQVPWLSGLAAVGGVLITNTANSDNLIGVFADRPILLIVAAVFGLTPDLLIRRLQQQVERYKEDLRSTQSSQSTEDAQSSQYGQRRSASGKQRR